MAGEPPKEQGIVAGLTRFKNSLLPGGQTGNEKEGDGSRTVNRREFLRLSAVMGAGTLAAVVQHEDAQAAHQLTFSPDKPPSTKAKELDPNAENSGIHLGKAVWGEKDGGPTVEIPCLIFTFDALGLEGAIDPAIEFSLNQTDQSSCFMANGVHEVVRLFGPRQHLKIIREGHSAPTVGCVLIVEDELLAARLAAANVDNILRVIPGKPLERKDRIDIRIEAGSRITRKTSSGTPVVLYGSDFTVNTLSMKAADRLHQIQDEISSKKPEQKERDETSNALVIDITRQTLEGIPNVPNPSDKELAQLLEIELPITLDKLHVPEDPSKVFLVALQFLKLYFQGHGEDVVETMQRTDELLGILFRPPNIKSLTGKSIGKITFSYESRNLVVKFRLDPEKLAEQIRGAEGKFVCASWQTRASATIVMYRKEMVRDQNVPDPREATFVNGAYQLPDGTVITRAQYQELWGTYLKPKFSPNDEITLEPHDAYANPVDAYLALKDMAYIAGKNPGRIFFIAAGNPTLDSLPDISDAIQRLREEGLWRENIIPIGFAHYDVKSGEVWNQSGQGAYYYVDETSLEEVGMVTATSFAAPMALRLVSALCEVEKIEPTNATVLALLSKYSRGDGRSKVLDLGAIQREINCRTKKSEHKAI